MQIVVRDQGRVAQLLKAGECCGNVLDVVEHLARNDKVKAAALKEIGREDVAGNKRRPWTPSLSPLNGPRAHVDADQIVTDLEELLRLVSLAASNLENGSHVSELLEDQTVGLAKAELLPLPLHAPRILDPV